MEGTIGEIRIFAGNFAPLAWSFCDGSTLSISGNEALYTLIGTTYGGDGVQTFKVPDLRSRIPVGTGQGPGLPQMILGQVGGAETAVMSSNQMPAHTHMGTGTVSIPAYSLADTAGSPTNAELAGLTGAYSTETADTSLKPETSTVNLAAAGQGIPFSIIQPYTSANYIICVEGIFPTRN
ncbi:tail fiber protein [Flavobacterium sp. Fl-77]|uniref:Tail fiber protein n=1 Tax=Flavobacterium flavipigmentatum TaxID=2893884 RepID=A0AAJ2VY65_9FLAO|nr:MULTISPECIES: tail fiber protein [unclassified Flavobacterium]MDX6183219.1 tail fiber protein [Flavobacterium sp. Fl-33]MDX6187617.1 tail fiber protein [Flavobacterium sp. Fl-77]UFH40368.1 tail fiber protein [Flavobacterium sp. F-70]